MAPDLLTLDVPAWISGGAVLQFVGATALEALHLGVDTSRRRLVELTLKTLPSIYPPSGSRRRRA